MLQHQPLGEELGVDVLVVGVLAAPELLLGEDLGRISDAHTRDTARRHLDEPGAFLFAEGHQVLHAAVVDLLDVVALGEMLHVGGAVDHQVEFPVCFGQLVENGGFGDIALDHPDAFSDEEPVFPFEVVDEHLGQPVFRLQGALAAQQAPDGRLVGRLVDEFPQHVHAQEARGSGEQNVAAQPPRLAGQRFERVGSQQLVDGRVVVVRHVFLGGRSARIRVRGLGRFPGQVRGQGPGGGIDEHFAIADLEAALFGLDQDAGHHQRGAAQVEETVEGAHLFDVEHPGEYLAEGAFRVGGRFHVRACGGHHGRRQGLAVDFLVDVERNGFKLVDGGRYHIGRLAFQNERAEGLRIERPFGHDVGGDELAARRCVEGLDRDVLHARELPDHGLDFLGFHAEAADLHLAVVTPHELDVPVGPVPDDVARAVHAVERRLVVERIGDEGLGRLVGAVEVAPAHLGAGDPQFACCAGGQPSSGSVHHVEAYVVERMPDGNVFFLLLHVEDRGEDGAFSGPVAVVEPVGRRID